MTDSTRRGLRSAYQALLALATVFPALLAVLPAGSPAAAKVAAAAASVGAVSALLNRLEDAGLIPAWLKATAADEPVWADAADAPAEH